MTVPLFIRTNKRDIMTPIKPTLDWQLKSETIPCMVIKSAFIVWQKLILNKSSVVLFFLQSKITF